MILELLKRVTSSLEEKEIEYMLSGSVAMNMYTIPRMTRDIDIVLHLKIQEIDAFSAIFANGYYLNKEGIKTEISRHGMFNVIDFKSGQKIDFIIRKNTPFHLEEFKRKKKVDAFGFPVWVVSPEDLIISKLIWIQELKSDTQIEDISNLLEDTKIDRNYLSKWIIQMNLNTYDLL